MKQCPVCEGSGQTEVHTIYNEIILDSDGNCFYQNCGACRGTGEVPDNFEVIYDDRYSEDDYRKEEFLGEDNFMEVK